MFVLEKENSTPEQTKSNAKTILQSLILIEFHARKRAPSFHRTAWDWNHFVEPES